MKTRKQHKALLDRARGYAAYARRQLPARRTLRTETRSWDLAQAIAARYAGLKRRWPAMALVFEQPDRAGVSLSQAYHSTHCSIFINPRVLLRMLVHRRVESPRAVADPIPTPALGRVDAPMTSAASARPKQGVQEQDDVIKRIVQRAVRDENPSKASNRPQDRSSGRLTQFASGENDSARQAPARVYRHAAKANGDASPVAAERTKREGVAVLAGSNNAAAVAQPLNITRITDQVMQALDRRIVAQRERMGRV